MTFTPRSRLVNPRLGTYFGIFAALLVSVFILAIIFEYLGVADLRLRWLMLAAPLLLYLVIGAASYTQSSTDYFAAGRRVPAIYTGISLAVSALGATGFAAVTGVFFVSGYDGLAITIGGLAGFVVMGILLAPFLRKFGAYTVPTYLGRRFASNWLRIAAAVFLAVPMLLIVAAELGLGAYVAGWLVGWRPATILPLLAGVVLTSLVLGGMRSLSWSSAAQAITAVLAILLMAALVALIVTKIPVPQLSSGPVVRSLLRQEASLALPQTAATQLAFNLPGEGFVTVSKRFAATFVDIGPAAFVITLWTVMAGLASAPWLLPRVSATPSVYDARKSLGWATFFFGVLVLTMISVAAFLREPLVDMALNGSGTEWLTRLREAGLAELKSNATRVSVSNVAFARDGVLMALPLATGLPLAVAYFTAAAILAAALASAGATVTALANLMAEDLVNGLAQEPPTDAPRLLIARAMLAGATIAGTTVAVLTPTDPLKLMLWALAITASTAFPVLVLSIWWKRINGPGAAAGMAAGFAVAVLAIVAGEARLVSVAGSVLAALGLPLGTIAAMAVSVLTAPPSRHVLELARDIRVPGGEILYDREMHRLRLKQRRAPK
ncbi:MAG: sodium:solute symporter [Hyphomicrobiaceae bacterium]|nr:sodium:solute symporter [Hyphomicrobiaceae bacterium]